MISTEHASTLRSIRNVVLIGDSFATDSLAGRLDVHLQDLFPSCALPVRVAGYPGAGLTEILPKADETLRDLDDVFILHVYPDVDAGRHWGWFSGAWYRRSLPTAMRDYPRLTRQLTRFEKFLPAVSPLAYDLYRSTINSSLPYRAGIEADLALLARFIDEQSERGNIYCCGFWDLSWYGQKNHFRRRLSTLDSRTAWIFTDEADELAVFHPATYLIPNDGHPNALGQDLFATYWARKIRDRCINIRKTWVHGEKNGKLPPKAHCVENNDLKGRTAET